MVVEQQYGVPLDISQTGFGLKAVQAGVFPQHLGVSPAHSTGQFPEVEEVELVEDVLDVELEVDPEVELVDDVEDVLDVVLVVHMPRVPPVQ